jgi:hypothetical protein
MGRILGGERMGVPFSVLVVGRQGTMRGREEEGPSHLLSPWPCTAPHVFLPHAASHSARPRACPGRFRVREKFGLAMGLVPSSYQWREGVGGMLEKFGADAGA